MTLAFIVIAALLCESVLETMKTIWSNGKLDLTRLLAIILGMVICFAFNVDIFYLFGLVSPVPFIGSLFTGIIISRGANFVHDLYKALEGFKNNIKTPL